MEIPRLPSTRPHGPHRLAAAPALGRVTAVRPAGLARLARLPRILVSVVSEDAIQRRRIAAALMADGLAVHSQGHSLEGAARGKPAAARGVIVAVSDISRAETVAALRTLRRRAPHVHVVIVSPSSTGTGIRRALNAGADGFVLEQRLDATLAPTVRAVGAGHVCVPRELRRCVTKPCFSHREKEILELVTLGLTNRAIAERLFLTESTVKSHLSSLFGKLGVHSRKEAAALLLDPEEGLRRTSFPADTCTVRAALSSGPDA